jgi:O-antigen ligase
MDAGWLVALAVFGELVLLPIEGLSLAVPGVVFGSTLLVVVAGVSLMRARKLRVGQVSFAAAAWCAFVTLAVASLMWTGNPAYGTWKLAVLLATGLLPGLLARILVSAGRPFSWQPVAVAGTVYLIAAVLVAHEVPQYPGRLTMPGGNPIWLARAAVLATFAIWLVSGWTLVMRMSLAALGTYLALASGSRGPAAAAFLLAGLGLLWAMATSRRRVRLLGAAIAAGAVAVAVVLLAPKLPFGGAGVLSRGRIVASLEAGALARDENVLSRRHSILAGLEAFAEAPLLGVGIGGLARHGEREYPHNLVVEVAAELGVVGLAAFLAALWFGWRSRRGDGAGRLLLAFCAFSALVSGDLASNAALATIALAPPLRGGVVQP